MFLRLGIICSFTHFDAGVFRDFDNFPGRPLGNHYSSLKSVVHWMCHAVRAQQVEVAYQGDFFFYCLKCPPQQRFNSGSRSELERARKVPNIKRAFVQQNTGILLSTWTNAHSVKHATSSRSRKESPATTLRGN